MTLTTRAKVGEQMVNLHGCVLLGSERLAPCPHQVTFTCKLSSRPDQSVLPSVRKSLKHLRSAAQKPAQCAAIPVLTLFLGFHPKASALFQKPCPVSCQGSSNYNPEWFPLSESPPSEPFHQDHTPALRQL